MHREGLGTSQCELRVADKFRNSRTIGFSVPTQPQRTKAGSVSGVHGAHEVHNVSVAHGAEPRCAPLGNSATAKPKSSGISLAWSTPGRANFGRKSGQTKAIAPNLMNSVPKASDFGHVLAEFARTCRFQAKLAMNSVPRAVESAFSHSGQVRPKSGKVRPKSPHPGQTRTQFGIHLGDTSTDVCKAWPDFDQIGVRFGRTQAKLGKLLCDLARGAQPNPSRRALPITPYFCEICARGSQFATTCLFGVVDT